MLCLLSLSFLFFFNDTATTEIYTLSLHDALPIFESGPGVKEERVVLHRVEIEVLLEAGDQHPIERESQQEDRKSTRLNSSHGYISYAVFCLKKKKKKKNKRKIIN